MNNYYHSFLNSSGMPWQESLESSYIYCSALQQKHNCAVCVLINLKFQRVLNKMQQENRAVSKLFVCKQHQK